MKTKKYSELTAFANGFIDESKSIYIFTKSSIVGKMICSSLENRSDEKNNYSIFNRYIVNDRYFSECDYNIENFNRFIEFARTETQNGDTRPIYIFNFFERLDEASDITQFIDALASLGRQVFVGVSNTYPLERFENNKVQLV